MKMLINLLFDRKPVVRDEDLWNWARIEYKKDADWAFAEMKEKGVAPTVGAL